jgi:hypothetical protein
MIKSTRYKTRLEARFCSKYIYVPTDNIKLIIVIYILLVLLM